MKKRLLHLFFTLIVVGCYFNSNAQNTKKGTPCSSTKEVDVWIHNIKSKQDVEKIEYALLNSALIEFIEVRDFPQQYTSLLICANTTPEDLNKILKPLGFYLSTPTFADPKLIEKDLIDSRKQETEKN